MGEPRLLHQVRDADAVEPALAKEARAGIEDPLAARRRLFLADFHVASSDRIENCLTVYMTIII